MSQPHVLATLDYDYVIVGTGASHASSRGTAYGYFDEKIAIPAIR